MNIKYSFILMLALILAGCGADRPFQRGVPVADNGALQTDNPPDTGGSPDTPPADDVCIIVEGSDRKVCENEFNLNILPAIQKSCTECHDEFMDFASATKADFFTAGSPEKSLLYMKPTRQVKHKRLVWEVDSAEARSLAEWITGR